MDIGVFPWWTDPTLKAEFLQALTVLTHRLDYALWPDSPALMHAQSLFWLGTAVAAAAVFYRRMLGATWVAAVAALLFAVDDARGATVGFIANRNVLSRRPLASRRSSATTAGGARARGRRRCWRRSCSPSHLFSKEEGIGTCAYLAAYALFADPAGRWRGCLALLPYAGWSWAGGLSAESWGYGVQNMGLYIDPLTDPGRFAAAVADRASRSSCWPVGPDSGGDRRRAAAAALRPCFGGRPWSSCGLLILAVAPLLKRDRLARFWAAGMLFADHSRLRHLPDGPAPDVRRHRRVRPARPVLGVCVRQLGQRPLESLVANPGACAGLVFCGRPRGLGPARSSRSAAANPAGARGGSSIVSMSTRRWDRRSANRPSSS